MPQSPRCLSLEQALAELVNLRASRNRRDAGPEIKALGDALGQTQRLGCDSGAYVRE
jgi:hypothetical protein